MLNQTSYLALLGGQPVFAGALPPYQSIGEAEKAAVLQVLESGCLSGFYGSWSEQFWGGPHVRELEAAWAARFNVAHAVSVNSNTSGLFAAMAAIGIQPGDEVIVPPLTMSATVMAPLVYGAIPVFCDVTEDTFCLNVAQVENLISPRTRAVLAVNLFGHPAPLQELRALCNRKGIFLIEDNAQAPLAEENGHLAGTIGHIGVWSLNYHKHIHCGEGGICTTDDENLALRLQMVRNHGENIVESAALKAHTDIVGFNYRMTEMSAAVALAQLARIEEHLAPRLHLAKTLTTAASGLEGITVPIVRPGCKHVYYVWAARFDVAKVGVSARTFARALTAEGFPHSSGYVEPLYRLPIVEHRVGPSRAFAAQCPIAERLDDQTLLLFEVCSYQFDENLLHLLGEAWSKVYAQRTALKGWESQNGNAHGE